MATVFAGQAIDARIVRAAVPSKITSRIPCSHAFTPSTIALTTPHITPRNAELRAQRAAVSVRAMGADNVEEEYEDQESFQERVVQVRRVTKVVKGGKQLRFRAVVSREASIWNMWHVCEFRVFGARFAI